MEDTIFALLLRDIGDKKEAIKNSLAGGMVKSYEDYCGLVGEYSALSRVENDIKDLEKRFIAD